MKALVECLMHWLEASPAESKAWQILRALARETLKVADHPDVEQREFDALDLAQASEPGRAWNYDAAKRWLQNANVAQFIEARRPEMEAYFRERGHLQAVTADQRSTSGRYRAQWLLKSYELPPQDVGGFVEVVQASRGETGDRLKFPQFTYEFTPAGEVKPNWLGRALLGGGSFRTWSARGLLWATLMIGSVFVLVFFGYVFIAMSRIQRPMTTSDLFGLVMLMAVSWIFWRFCVRPWMWLLEDRIVPTAEVLCGWKEDPAQLELARQGEYRYLRLVRYGGVCPICAGRIELRYGQGPSRRRLFGCCTEAPQDHVYTFDRVTRLGTNYHERPRS
jgi:hypothetical protein